MGIEALLIAAAVAGSPAADCAAAGAKQPALRKVIDAAAALRQAASQPEASFSRLVAQAKSLSALGKSALSQIQEAGCADEAQTALLEACTAPLTWSCESVPPGIDWSFLSRVKRSEDEDLALSLGDPILAGPVNLFATCCGDFGCIERGVGVPGSLYQDETAGQLVRLAGFKTAFGRTALETLRKSSAGLARASCTCDDSSPEDRAGLAAKLSASAKTSPADSAAPLRAISAALKKGFPKKPCAMPGGGD